MNDTVVGIHGGPVDLPQQEGTPSEPVVKFLKQLLERAESGEVVAVFGGYTDDEGLGSFVVGGGQSVYSMVGAMQATQWAMLNDVITD